MLIGSKVKLKDIPANKLKWLLRYRDVIGEVIDFQARTDKNPPVYARISFLNDGTYEDLAMWRLVKV